ncbi:MAG: cell division protein FtsQ/DivIB [Thermaurantimonas sp.]
MQKVHRIFRVVFLVVLLVGFLVITAFSGRKLDTSPVRLILVDILQNDDKYMISKDDILNMCSDVLNNDSILIRKSINTKVLEEILNAQKSIEHTEIFFTLNGELHILVKPRTPSLRILGRKSDYYVDLQNHTFPLSRHYSAFVPVVDGRVTDDVIRSLNQIMEMSQKDAFLKNFFSGFYVSSTGEITAYSTLFDESIYFGKPEQTEEKLLRLKVFYSSIYPTLEKKKIRSVNLRFDKQVICEYEQ